MSISTCSPVVGDVIGMCIRMSITSMEQGGKLISPLRIWLEGLRLANSTWHNIKKTKRFFLCWFLLLGEPVGLWL